MNSKDNQYRTIVLRIGKYPSCKVSLTMKGLNRLPQGQYTMNFEQALRLFSLEQHTHIRGDIA